MIVCLEYYLKTSYIDAFLCCFTESGYANIPMTPYELPDGQYAPYDLYFTLNLFSFKK